MSGVKKLVEMLVRELVDAPDEVEIEEMKSSQSTILTVKVNASDVGKVIGKAGRNAKAIRTLLGAVGAKNHTRILFEIEE